jgi:ankyrin repeat protein
LFLKGNTPLHEACFFGRDDAVKELLQAGASWKFVNKLGWTSLHVHIHFLNFLQNRFFSL